MNQLIEFAGNHFILVSAFFFIIALLVVNLVQSGGSGALFPSAAITLLNQENAVPVDLRAKADFDAGHIINAVHLPAGELKSRAGELKKYADRPLLLYCASGASSASAVRDLNSAGFERVYSLKGGLSAWRADNLPLT